MRVAPKHRCVGEVRQKVGRNIERSFKRFGDGWSIDINNRTDYPGAMSSREVETMIRSLSPEELRRFAEWWELHRRSLLNERAERDSATGESEAVRAELIRRKQEYRDHPERYSRMESEALDQMFKDIENEAH